MVPGAGSTNLEFRSNLMANGAIMDGDPRFKWVGNTTPFSTQGFELNDGLVNMSMHHNDINNNTGWAVIANRYEIHRFDMTNLQD